MQQATFRWDGARATYTCADYISICVLHNNKNLVAYSGGSVSVEVAQTSFDRSMRTVRCARP